MCFYPSMLYAHSRLHPVWRKLYKDWLGVRIMNGMLQWELFTFINMWIISNSNFLKKGNIKLIKVAYIPTSSDPCSLLMLSKLLNCLHLWSCYWTAMSVTILVFEVSQSPFQIFFNGDLRILHRNTMWLKKRGTRETHSPEFGLVSTDYIQYIGNRFALRPYRELCTFLALQ